MQIIRVHTEHAVYEGTLLPSKPGTVTVKLRNGYNVGLKKSSVLKEEMLGELPEHKASTQPVLQPSDKPLISIIHLGGTIASKVDYSSGAVTAHFKPEELLQLFPELEAEARIESRLIGNMMSGAMQPGHYNAIAEAVAEELEKKPKGIIISHGTDTIVYTAAALSFILENIPVPVVLVGSQRSSDRGSSDAAVNLISAAHFIVNTHWRGVGICMHKTSNDDTCWILPGTNAAKMHTSRRDAFRPVNSRQVADVNVKERVITYFRDESYSTGEFKLRLIDPEVRIGVVKMHPGLRHTELAHYESYDGLVLEGTGMGHAPVIHYDEHTRENAAIYETIQSLAKKMPLVMVSQCPYGRVNMQVYNYGRLLVEAGVLGHENDMTAECAYMKLLWLLSNEREQARELVGKSLRGEISTRTEPDTFLL